MQLSLTMQSLDGALAAAQVQTNKLNLQPLVGQLHEAAGRLRQSANGNAAVVNPIASRLDAAAGELLQVGLSTMQEADCAPCIPDVHQSERGSRNGRNEIEKD